MSAIFGHTNNMSLHDKGFSSAGAVLVILLVGVVGFIGWRLYSQSYVRPSADTRATSADYIRIVALGDVVCDPLDIHRINSDQTYCQDEQVAQQVKAANPHAVLLLGDLQYSDGTLDKFQHSFSKNWAGFKDITYPTPGNHEYATPSASGYYTYFKDGPIDVSRGYYQVVLGDWQVIALNSNCGDIGGCAPSSEQVSWLETELGKNNSACRLAFWHHPRFSSGMYMDNADVKARSDIFWPKLMAQQTDIILNGHDHLYERFAPQDAHGQSTSTGPRQFTVGTGGKSHYKAHGVAANSERIIDDQYGILILDLYKNSYTWEFKNIHSQVLDSGRQECL